MKPRILLVCSRKLPFPTVAGYGIRILNSARYLASQYDVDLLFLDKGGFQQLDLRAFEGIFKRIMCFSYSPSSYALNALRGLASRGPIQVRYFTFREVRAWIQAHQHEYQAILGQHVRVAEMLRDLETPVAIDLVDAISLNYARAAEQARGPWRLIYAIEKERLIRYEVETVNRFPRSFVVSELDRQHLVQHGADPDRLMTLPVAIQDHVIQRSPFTGPEEDAIALLGNMAYHPNKDAALYFAHDVFPRIRARMPHCKLYVVGAEPPKEVQALADLPGVEVTGFVEDPSHYLERAKVVVAPIRFGAGLKNKVLEGMALRKAVVTSTIGQEGIGGTDGREYLVADTSETLASSVLRCLGDSSLRAQLGTNARSWIERHFDSRAIGEQTLRSLATLHPSLAPIHA